MVAACFPMLFSKENQDTKCAFFRELRKKWVSKKLSMQKIWGKWKLLVFIFNKSEIKCLLSLGILKLKK